MGWKLKWTLSLLAALTVGAVGGGYAVQVVTVRTLWDSAIDIDTHSLRVYSSALAGVRGGEGDAALEEIEAWMDLTLIRSMEPTNYDVRIRPVTLARADSAFHAVRAYREAYPRETGTGVDAMVASVLSGAPPSEMR